MGMDLSETELNKRVKTIGNVKIYISHVAFVITEFIHKFFIVLIAFGFI